MDNMREVILGRSSKIWQTIKDDKALSPCFQVAIGHSDLKAFEFTPSDRVWVFSYSNKPEENSRMLKRLANAGISEIIYVTSSSTRIAPLTQCYAYPRAKKLAEDEAAALHNCKILTLGLVVSTWGDLPGGRNAATSHLDLIQFMNNPTWRHAQGRKTDLLQIIDRPFGGSLEAALYRAYGFGLRITGRQPCLLRPVDLVLRAMGMRWYGYTYLSNQLWARSTGS